MMMVGVSLSHGWHVGPIETGSGEEHIADEGFDGRLAHEPDEEELLDDLGGDRPKGWEPKEKLPEPDGLVRVLRPAVLLQGALGLFLKALDVSHVRQAASVCKMKDLRQFCLLR